MRKFFPSLIVSLFLISGSLCAAEKEPDLLDQIQASLQTLTSLEVKFEQTRHLTLFEDELKSEGILYFTKPAQMRWQITHPYRSALIFNQGQVAKFEIKDGKPRKKNMAASHLFSEIMGQMMAMLIGDFSNIEKSYRIETKKTDMVAVTLIPRSEKLFEILQSITLMMDPETFKVKALLIRESSEDDIQIVFKNEKENQALPPSLFSLHQPDGFSRQEVPR